MPAYPERSKALDLVKRLEPGEILARGQNDLFEAILFDSDFLYRALTGIFLRVDPKRGDISDIGQGKTVFLTFRLDQNLGHVALGKIFPGLGPVDLEHCSLVDVDDQVDMGPIDEEAIERGTGRETDDDNEPVPSELVKEIFHYRRFF